VPLRDRNDLLTAAGFAAIYRESGLDAPAMTQARRALDFILRQQEPYPALVLDRHWNVLEVNQGSARFQARFLDRRRQASVRRTRCASCSITTGCGPTSSTGRRRRRR